MSTTAKLTVEDFERMFGKYDRRPSIPAPVPVAVTLPVAAPVREGRIFVLPLGAQTPIGEGRCCALATRVPCVCRVSWECPQHARVCVGSHD